MADILFIMKLRVGKAQEIRIVVQFTIFLSSLSVQLICICTFVFLHFVLCGCKTCSCTL